MIRVVTAKMMKVNKIDYCKADVVKQEVYSAKSCEAYPNERFAVFCWMATNRANGSPAMGLDRD